MGRKKSAGLASDLMDIVAWFPWWVGVALALISYVLLHSVATQAATVNVQPGQIGAAATRAIWVMLATVGQYALPFVCLCGALMSALQRSRRRSLHEHASVATAASALDGMSWREFEMLVGEAFRRRGFSVTELGGDGPDGGIDLVLRKGNEKFLVQCKQWKAYKVGVDVVRELYGLMAAHGAAGGFVVTSGSFTADAQAFAEGRNVQLMDGLQLLRMIQEARPAVAGMDAEPADLRLLSVDRGPVCPVCGAGMVRRTARRGARSGGAFLGCTAYPACRGTRSIG